MVCVKNLNGKGQNNVNQRYHSTNFARKFFEIKMLKQGIDSTWTLLLLIRNRGRFISGQTNTVLNKSIILYIVPDGRKHLICAFNSIMDILLAHKKDHISYLMTPLPLSALFRGFLYSHPLVKDKGKTAF